MGKQRTNDRRAVTMRDVGPALGRYRDVVVREVVEDVNVRPVRHVERSAREVVARRETVAWELENDEE